MSRAAPSPPAKPLSRRSDGLATEPSPWPASFIALLLAIVTFILYWPVRNYPFISWDDPLYVTANATVQQGLTFSNVAWAFTNFHAANWHPLTWLTHMLDCSVFGPDAPGGPHMVNVALHAINAVLLFAVLRMMTGSLGRSAAVAMFFAVHPLRVESVAWISERKDVLSTLFGLLAIMAYVRWTRAKSLARYLLIVVCMSLSLMAKPMLVTLPGVLLLLDVWPLNRIDVAGGWRVISRRLVSLCIEKAPLMGLSLGSCLMTVLAQARWSAFATFEMVPWSVRLGMSVTGIARYVQFTFWPQGLALLYPQEVHPLAQWLPSAILLALVSIIAVLQVRARPWVFVGWFWFLGTLVPVIGLVKVGSQSIADRYTYVPTIGLTLMIVWLVSDLLARVLDERSAARVGIAGAGIIAVALSLATREQLSYWRDPKLLYERAIAVTIPNWTMHNVLGMYLIGQRDFGGAAKHFREAVRLQPNEVEVLNNLAVLLLVDPEPSRRNPRQGLLLAMRANELSQTPRVAFIDTLAAAFAAVGMFDDAIVTAERAVKLAQETGQSDVAAQIAAKIPGYREGKVSGRIYVEGVAPPAKPPSETTTAPREDR